MKKEQFIKLDKKRNELGKVEVSKHVFVACFCREPLTRTVVTAAFHPST